MNILKYVTWVISENAASYVSTLYLKRNKQLCYKPLATARISYSSFFWRGRGVHCDEDKNSIVQSDFTLFSAIMFCILFPVSDYCKEITQLKSYFFIFKSCIFCYIYCNVSFRLLFLPVKMAFKMISASKSEDSDFMITQSKENSYDLSGHYIWQI